MFPGSNANANLGYNKHNQYMAQPPHFLTAPAIPGPCPVPIPGSGPGVGNPLGATASGMPLNMQGGIDWAQLAQQWIHMRDSSATAPLSNFSMAMPIAPPPPIISNAPEYQLLQQHQQRHQQAKAQMHYEEHGEAEMDMDMDEDDSGNNTRVGHVIESQPPPPPVTQSQWVASRVNDATSNTILSNAPVGSGTQQWNDWSSRNNPTAHIPSLLKINVCNPNEPPLLQHQVQQPQLSSSSGGGGGGSGSVNNEIDANKRKMLPAWIREGLEKMEREKQRQIDRQQPPTPETETSDINVKQVSSKTLTTPVNLLNMSNVASDSDDSTAAPEEATHAPSMALQLIGNDVLSKASSTDDDPEYYEEKKEEQQQQQNAGSLQNVATVARAANDEAALSGKNYEERLADLMLVVRRTLTEILLETTNEEIAAIATETVKAHRAKASSAQVIRKSALSSITGNLGLAVYGDSSSESDDDNADDNDDGQVERAFDSTADKTSELSADELKARIRKSKRAFERVIDDIEERVSMQEQMDEQKLQYHRKLELEQTEAAKKRAESEQRHTESPADKTASAATSTTVSTNDKLQQFNGKRLSRKERTTRFSDNKDGKQAPTYVSQVVTVATAQNSILPQKLKPVPNPATNLLQMPESMASMLSAADKALDKANKTSKRSKGRRRQYSSSSSSSSSGDSSSSSSSSGSNTSSNSSKSSSNSNTNSTKSSAVAKKYGRTSHLQSKGSSGHRQRVDSSRKSQHQKGHSSGRGLHNYDRQHSGRGSRERDRDRGCDRDRGRHAVHYNRQYPDSRRRHHRDSSHSTEENGSSRYRRHSSSRSHQSSSYGKHRERTRSRSNSRSTHNSHSSASTSHHQRKRK